MGTNNSDFSPTTNGARSMARTEPMLEGHEEANPLHHLLEGSLRQRVIDAGEALPSAKWC
ncbi:hypothetical protein J4732_17000 [Serratia marcescens]|uniref:Uncharacterized protein n=1 Tax=Serratia marcescens TaxID=615 RepID=A0A939NQ93_SERMA|nr:hypothetical protein [Serratia marcescens]